MKRNDAMWVLADEDDLPERWTDGKADRLRCVCSNGWEGSYSLGSAFDHKPKRWPQYFPKGEDGDAACTVVILLNQH